MFNYRALVGLAIGLLTTVMGTAAADAGADAGPLRIVVLGDSLTAGYLLPPSEAFPIRLEKALKAGGYDVRIANAGVSGDTTAAALARLDWAVPPGTEAVIVELGANDALRGLSPAAARSNLDRILTALKARGIAVLIAGMLAPPNMDAAYAKPFDAIFPALARKHDALLYPFFLAGVAADPALNLSDGIHPNPRGIGVIVKGILPKVEELITRIRKQRIAKSRG